MLEVEGCQLFVPAAAAQFLLESGGCLPALTVEDESWLHWETSALYPVILALLSKVTDAGLLQQVRALATRLEEECTKQQYLRGGGLHLLDILVWCDLYPVLTDNKVKKEFASLPSVLKWFETVSKHPSVMASLGKLKFGFVRNHFYRRFLKKNKLKIILS